MRKLLSFSSRFRTSFLALALILIVPIVAYGNEVIDVQLRWLPQFQFAGYYAALEKGFYGEEGLDVRLHAGDPAHQPVHEVLAGHAQYAEGNSEVLFHRLQGKPLVALASIFQHSASVLLVRKDSGILSPHDLVGKKVMLMNLTEDPDFLAMFRNEGVPIESVKAIPSSYDISDLISGKVDAFNAYLTNEPFFLQEQNVKYAIINPESYQIDFYSDVLFTTEAEVRDHPQRVQAMVRATLRGWRYAMDHPDEIMDLLVSKYHVGKSRKHLEFEAGEIRKLILPDLIEIGYMNPGRWGQMAETFVKAGLVHEIHGLDGFVYDPSPKPMPMWLWHLLIAACSALAVVLAVVIVLFRLYNRLSRTQASLAESEERLRLALGAARQAWFDVDLTTGATSVSDAYARLLGFDPAQFRPDLAEWQNSLHPEDRPAVMEAFNNCVQNGGPVSMEYRRRTKDSGWVWLNSLGKITKWSQDHKALRMVGIHMDISERKKFQLELERQAQLDFLTGINNRRHFIQLAEVELNRSRRYCSPLSLFMIDLDHFKQINDSFGHKAGDVVIRNFVEVCQAILREVDIIGRIGGEEFAVLLPETDLAEALVVAERLRVAIQSAKVVIDNGPPLGVTMSIGVVSVNSGEDSVDLLLSRADQALYAAKNAGRNRVVNWQAQCVET